MKTPWDDVHNMLDGPRQAKLNELPKIIDLVNSIFLSRPDVPPIMGELFPQLFSRENLENLRVIVEDERPVSHAGIWEGELLILGSWFKVGMIGSVCTHPDYRKKRYASTLVRDALSKMRRNGVDLALVSGSRDLYKRVGFVEAGKIHMYRIQRGKLSLKKTNASVKPYGGNVMDLVEVYQKEPVRYQRSLEEFKLLAERVFRCSDVRNICKIYTAMRGSRPLAYVATNVFPSRDVPIITEYAGSRNIILYLVNEVFEIANVDMVKLIVPFHDLELHRLLEDKGVKKPQSKPTAGVFIVNPLSFLEKVKSYLEERMGKIASSNLLSDLLGKSIELTARGGEVRLDRSQALTLLFFGEPEKLNNPPQPKLALEPDLEFPSNILPLPTPVAGLNHI